MLVCAAAAVFSASEGHAQTPRVLYTWDQSFGTAIGENLETWSGSAISDSGNVPTLSNATDGLLTVTEAIAGGNFQIQEGFNTAIEAPNDLGGIDLFGLDALEIDVSYTGVGDVSGSVFLQPDDGTGCCGFFSAPFTISPGANTISVDLNGLATSGFTPEASAHVRSIGIQVFGNSEPAPVTYEFSEIRSVGPPALRRVLADFSDPDTAASLGNAVVNFDNGAIDGNDGGQNSSGFSIQDNALTFIDLGGDGSPGAPSGGAITFGNGNAPSVSFSSRPVDISNYDTAELTIRVSGESTIFGTPAETIDVEFFVQHQNTDNGSGFNFANLAPLTLDVVGSDGEFVTVEFALDGFADTVDLSLLDTIGLNFAPHAGTPLTVQIQSFVLTAVPEPSSIGLLGIAMLGVARRRRVV